MWGRLGCTVLSRVGGGREARGSRVPGVAALAKSRTCVVLMRRKLALRAVESPTGVSKWRGKAAHAATPQLRRTVSCSSSERGEVPPSAFVMPPSLVWWRFSYVLTCLSIPARANASTAKRSRYETSVYSSKLPRLDLRARVAARHYISIWLGRKQSFPWTLMVKHRT